MVTPKKGEVVGTVSPADTPGGRNPLIKGRRNERGNIFALLFGAVALIGVLSVAAHNTLIGPIATMQRVQQTTLAKTQLLMSARIILNAPGSIDGDGDGMIEAVGFTAAGVLRAPVGGGLLPSDLGLSLTDPWGTAFGLCVWDHGTVNSSAQRLNGDNTATAATQPVLAVVSAGRDKTFQTTCAAYTSGPVTASAAPGSDDLVFKYSYAEAQALGGGLWTLKAGDTATAQLKSAAGVAKIEANRNSGILSAIAASVATITAPASASDTLQVGGGLRLDTATGTATTCGAGQGGALRLDALRTGLEICNGAGAWNAFRAVPVAPGSDKQVIFNDAGTLQSATGLTWDKATARLGVGVPSPVSLLQVAGAVQVANDAAACVAGKNGAIRLNTVLQVCIGSTWLPLLTAELDPKVGTLTPAKWCAANASGTAIDCTANAPAAAAVTDGDKGDVTVTGTGAAWTIDATAVTFGKIQNMTTGKLLGRSTAGSGSVEQINIGTGLTMTAGTLAATVAAESDPKVGTLSPSKWCASNAGGTAIDCTNSAPSVGFDAAQIWRSANLSIANATQVIPTFDVEAYDTAGFHSGSAGGFTIPAAFNGKWIQLQAGIRFAANSSGSRQLLFFKNNAYDAATATQTIIAPVTGVETVLNVLSAPIQVSTGDYFDMRIAQTSGVALDIQFQATWFAIRILN